MDYKKLHTYSLEQLYGPIKGQIIKQDKKIRMIHLLDENGISRTLGVVRFSNFNTKEIKDAHRKIVSGHLIGKTLHEFHIDFKKEFIGSFETKLPPWLKKDFDSSLDGGIVFYSKIWINTNSVLKDTFLYSELIEVAPLELSKKMTDKMQPLSEIEDSLLYLCEASGLTIIKKNQKL